MKINWRAIAELTGISAVVVSLLLVVFELRQTQASISAAAHSDRTMRNIEMARFGAEFGTDEIQQQRDSGEDLTTAQQQVLNVYLQMRLRHFEDLHYQHTIGTISDETWAANQEGLRWTVATKDYEKNWKSIRRFFRPSFVALAEQMANASD